MSAATSCGRSCGRKCPALRAAQLDAEGGGCAFPLREAEERIPVAPADERRDIDLAERCYDRSVEFGEAGEAAIEDRHDGVLLVTVAEMGPRVGGCCRDRRLGGASCAATVSRTALDVQWPMSGIVAIESGLA